MDHAIVGLRLKVLCMIGIFIYNPYLFQVSWYSKEKLSYLFHTNKSHQQKNTFFSSIGSVFIPLSIFPKNSVDGLHNKVIIRSFNNYKKC